MPGISDKKIVYTPLDQLPCEEYRGQDNRGPDSDLDGEDQDEDQECHFDRNYDESWQIFGRPETSDQPGGRPNLVFRMGCLKLHAGFTQLRSLLLLVAAFLSLVFLIQLSRSTPQDPPQPLRLAFKVNKSINETIESRNQPVNNPITPHYDSYLSSILNKHNSQVSDELVDDLADPESRNSTSPWWTRSQANAGKFVTLSNYIRAMKSFNHNSSVTLTTQATTEFMHHTLELCKRWDGPISVAIFTPGRELAVSLTLIKFMRICLPALLSACIRDKVTWHVAYNRAHGPPATSMSEPYKHLDANNFPMFVHQDLCPKFAGPEPIDLISQFEVELRKKNELFPNNYRKQFQLTYPINVLRNTARVNAKTKYIMASDIELYPSKNLVPAFINYVHRHNVTKELELNNDRYIFTLPIFEVAANHSAPKTKSELIELFHQGKAIFFHKWVCDACQDFPNRLDWLQTSSRRNDPNEEDELEIFGVARRDKTRSFWEPIFIGTNLDPPYDDRLTWEGRRDKMGQMYEMCLKDYRLLILANAFLVHAPGIKRIDRDDTVKRLKYLQENNAIYDETMAKLRQTYANSSSIGIC